MEQLVTIGLQIDGLPLLAQDDLQVQVNCNTAVQGLADRKQQGGRRRGCPSLPGMTYKH